MSNFEIHELTEKAINRNSNIIHDTLNGGSYETGKNLAGAVADLALEVVASEYDDTASYAIGSYCIYSGVLYRCTTATTGVFDVSDWTPVLVTDEYKRVRVMHKADFDLLTPEEQADGMIFVDDVDITADDITYSQGVSVADKLDNVPTFDSLTTGDNNKLLGVSVSGGGDIRVGAVGVSKSITPPTGAYINSKLSDVEFVKVQQGRLVCISLIFKVSSNLNAQEDIFTAGAIPSNMDNQQFVATIVSGTDTGKCGRVMLKDNGSLSDWYNGGSFFTTGKTFLINMTYLCK